MTEPDKHTIAEAIERYRRRTGKLPQPPRAVLFDMDGVLFNSMPGHAAAWKRMCDENGIPASEEEFFAYEGRTGASTINILFRRTYGREASTEEIEKLYARKSELFRKMPPVDTMAGAREALDLCRTEGIPSVLVTGSGQSSLLKRLDAEFPEAFPSGRRVTAADVSHGKPDPEPFIKGREKAGAGIVPEAVVAVDNAPLGVRSASESGAFTIGVNTGPIPHGALLEAGADIELKSMEECTNLLRELFHIV
ncbi:MAG: HAD hydrolase-like protein [Muribaculaceae bacterium]|nr:HAD hydrolase-like protein [Muribaculaceae bacterium]